MACDLSRPRKRELKDGHERLDGPDGPATLPYRMVLGGPRWSNTGFLRSQVMDGPATLR